MRIFLLTLLILAPVYYYKQSQDISGTRVKIDSIKLKMGAPDRIAPAIIEKKSAEEAIEPPAITKKSLAADPANDDESEQEEVQVIDLEEGWNNELKEMLERLEPADGEDIHRAYFAQQSSYQAELDSLLNEKEQKTSRPAALEIEYQINQLEEEHQFKLKEILGAHYEAVRDHYEDFMEAAQSDD